jgi:hypothetical protein
VKAIAAAAAALALTGTSAAAWSAGAGGPGVAAARSMPGGRTPTATVPLLSTTVTVTWPASSFAGGPAVEGYVVKRINATSGAVVNAGGGCSGVVHSTSCVESGVGIGQWKYSVTPAQGTWRGAEGTAGNVVTVPGV